MECPYHTDLVAEVKKISSDIAKLQNITVKNGDTKTLPVQHILGELWESSIVLRDFTRFHILCKKYRLYKIFFSVFILFVLFAFGISIKDIILKLIT
ncbi:MAG: hypothetical protein NTV87_12965 [Ignavibacteriae bacterium]|nr:hypothetical protein [Ignavibacteriota bacterium]